MLQGERIAEKVPAAREGGLAPLLRNAPLRLAVLVFLAVLLVSAAFGQEGYDDAYRRLNEVDPIDRIHQSLQRWGRVFLGIGLGLLALVGLKLVGPLRRYDNIKDNSLRKAVRGVDELVKRIQAEAEATSEEPPPGPNEEGLLAGMAEIADFSEAEQVPAYVLTVNDLMLDNIRVTLKKLRRHREGQAERYEGYMFSVLQGIQTISQQSAEAGVSSGLAVDIREYFRAETRFKLWTKVLRHYARREPFDEIATSFLRFAREVREGRSPTAAAAEIDPNEDTAISPALPSPDIPDVLDEETLPQVQAAAREEAAGLCKLIREGKPAKGDCAWQFELVRRQRQLRNRHEAHRMLSVFLNGQRKALQSLTRIRMLPCRTWDHVLYMLGVENGSELLGRVDQRLLTVQEAIILEKAFLQTFARRGSLEHVYGHDEDAALMMDIHVPDIQRQSLVLLRRLNQVQPDCLAAATETLNEEETPQNGQVLKLIEHYVQRRHDVPDQVQGRSEVRHSARDSEPSERQPVDTGGRRDSNAAAMPSVRLHDSSCLALGELPVKRFMCLIVLLIVASTSRFVRATSDERSAASKSRLIVLADMGNEPDEEQQMAHMLVCSNEFDVEGLIAITGKFLRKTTRPDLFLKLIDGYAKVVDNLKLHAEGWPTPGYLRSITVSGQGGYGIEATGKGKSSEGSKLIVEAVTRDDPRPVWIVVNAGSNTLAQALIDYRASHTPAEVDAFVAKLRVFENGAQDNAGAWICHHFPRIHWIRSNYQTYAYGGPGGRGGDIRSNLGPHYWQPYEYSVDGQNEWLKEHVMTGHGPLGEVFPERRFGNGRLGFMEGGGTIPWLGLVNKGLFDVDHPSWGGWSGRFTARKVPDFWSRHADIKADEIEVAPFYTHREVSDVWTDPVSGKRYDNDYVPVWRWRRAMYNDLRCRMDWCVKPFDEANHHPVAAFRGDTSDTIVRLRALAGEQVALDATASTDPDGDPLVYRWWVYREAGTYPGEVVIADTNKAKTSVRIPTGAMGAQIHVILEVKDENPIASLFDYRRIVIDVADMVVPLESVQK